MAIKPDFKEVKYLIKRTLAIDSMLRNYVEFEINEINELKNSAEIFYNDRLRASLEEIDVDILTQSKQGIRVSYLRDVGIMNMYQLYKMPEYQIESISGIGPQGAKKIKKLTKQIADNTGKKLSMRIDADNPKIADDMLIRAIYVLLERNKLRGLYKTLYDSHHEDIGNEVFAANKASGGLAWFFTPKRDKDFAINAIESLRYRLSTVFGDDSIFRPYYSIPEQGASVYRAYFKDNSAECYATLEKYCKYLNTSGKEKTGLSAELLEKIEAYPLDLKYMKATLRSYQTFGVKYAVHQKRTLLGDEMGLGKTIQALAAMAALKAEGKTHFMVVCPASVLINWCREIEKHSYLKPIKIHGADEIALESWIKEGDVAVTTYESISRFTLPEDFSFDMLVVDEAHYVKNPETQRTEAMVKLLRKTEGVLYMSGTPLINKVDEMCFLVSCLQPEIARKIERVKSFSTADQFREELSPVYLRRTREDVLKELPDLIEKEQWCELNKEEQRAYRSAVLSGNFMAIRQVSWQIADVKNSTKAKRLVEICEKAEDEGRKIIVFSFFRNTLNKVKELLGERCSDIISGDIPPERRQEIVDEFNKADPGAILVSQVQAGGTGLNIQAASVIVFCEPQLTPAIENQAVSRAYRMGQTRDVLVHRLLADETIDERMLQILSVKQKEFDKFADDSVMGSGQLEMEKEGENSWITKMVEAEQKRLLEESEENADLAEIKTEIETEIETETETE
ncbi:MAG: DEAD/DEAH box helicase [Ruminococcaceae bacterium]|nr:DEAD/DEAH box helicase [Oscillospiraceae bacterium]